MEVVLNSLSKEPHQRSKDDIKKIRQFTEGITFFNDISKEQDGSFMHDLCCRALLYKEFQPFEYVFKYGDVGDAYYILLSGEAQVLIPRFLANVGGQKEAQDEPKNEPVYLATLTTGNGFGDYALIQQTVRSASIQCITKCKCAILLLEDYKQILQELQNKQLENKILFIKSLPPFQNWTKTALLKISYFFKPKFCKKGQIIFKEGEAANHIFAVKSGQFILTKNYKKVYEKGFQKRRNSISPRKLTYQSSLDIVVKLPPAIFGFEDAWQGNNCRSTNCYCKEPGELYFISAKELGKRIQNPDFWTKIKHQSKQSAMWKKERLESLLKAQERRNETLLQPRKWKEEQVRYSSGQPEKTFLVKPRIVKFPNLMSTRQSQWISAQASPVASPVRQGRHKRYSSLIFDTEVCSQTIDEKRINTSFITPGSRQNPTKPLKPSFKSVKK